MSTGTALGGEAGMPPCPRCSSALRERGTVLQPFWECASCGFYAAGALRRGS